MIFSVVFPCGFKLSYYFDMFKCEYVGVSSVSYIGWDENRTAFRTYCVHLQNPICSVLEVVILIRGGDDRSFYFAKTQPGQRSYTLLKKWFRVIYLLCSLRV